MRGQTGNRHRHVKPPVSVVIPTRDNIATIDACLASVRSQEWDNLEIIVVNDGSIDGTELRCARHVADDARVHLFHLAHSEGAATARNVGLSHAKGEFVAFIDGDIHADPDWLALLLAPILADDADCTGGPDVVPPTDPLIARCVGHSMDSFLVTAGLRHGRTRLVKYLPGTGNMAVRRSVLESVGAFNPAFHDSGEDKELLYRVRDGGFRIRYVEEARVWHHRTTSLVAYARKMYLSGVRRVDIWRSLRGTLEFAHVVPAVLLVGALSLVACAFRGGEETVRLTVLVTTTGLFLLAVDGVWAACRLRALRAAAIVPLTSLLVVLGYGLGICAALLSVYPSVAFSRMRASRTNPDGRSADHAFAISPAPACIGKPLRHDSATQLHLPSTDFPGIAGHTNAG